MQSFSALCLDRCCLRPFARAFPPRLTNLPLLFPVLCVVFFLFGSMRVPPNPVLFFRFFFAFCSVFFFLYLYGGNTLPVFFLSPPPRLPVFFSFQCCSRPPPPPPSGFAPRASFPFPRPLSFFPRIFSGYDFSPASGFRAASLFSAHVWIPRLVFDSFLILPCLGCVDRFRCPFMVGAKGPLAVG